jgi:hypothetical protein
MAGTELAAEMERKAGRTQPPLKEVCKTSPGAGASAAYHPFREGLRAAAAPACHRGPFAVARCERLVCAEDRWREHPLIRTKLLNDLGADGAP